MKENKNFEPFFLEKYTDKLKTTFFVEKSIRLDNHIMSNV